MENETSAKEKSARTTPRDAEGHFTSKTTEKIASPISELLSKNISLSKTHDNNTLVDIHIGNPLQRIIKLLEEIKRQKAFSFTLKGSLGIMGVILALSLFGLFGGNKMLCDKGNQSHVGRVRILEIPDREESPIPVLSSLINAYNSLFVVQKFYPRIVLVKPDASVIHVPFTTVLNLYAFENKNVMATGQYNSCSQTLNLNHQYAVEIYP